MKRTPIGVIDYRRLKTDHFYVVDKSLMIKEFLDRQTIVTLVIRPRRFGKTLNMSMMAEFFDITKDSKDIFKDTNIMKTEYASYINQYPTIFLSFANAKGNKEQIVKYIKIALQKEYAKYEHVFHNMNIFEKNDYTIIVNGLLNKTDSQLENVDNALFFLMERLEDYYGKKVMVFIDEYDTPFIEAHVNGFYNEIKSGLSSLLHNSLKLSPSLQYAMLTGIQRVAKENIFSDLNNIVVCTVRDDEYNQYFGFDEKEVEELLTYYGLECNDEVQLMYDGYHIGNQDIYNPWSIINYAKRGRLDSYWVNTSSNTMIKNAVKNSDISFHQEYEKLIQDGELETQITLETSFYEYSSTPSLWGLFVNAGYLTISKVISLLKDKYKVRIPNQEVQKEFINLTEYYLSIGDNRLNKMMDSLIEKKQEEFLQEYRSILMLPSYHDLKNENSYHMMMLGMCVCLSHEYEVISNREEGKGRCDIILKSKKENKASYIIEFKYTKDKEELETLASQAIQQIKDKKYDNGLKGRIIYIGLAHCGKDVMMKWQDKT